MYSDPEDKAIYCRQDVREGDWPRCPVLEYVYNESLQDICCPPLPKPPKPKNHFEYKLATIEQLIKTLQWWVYEKLDEKLTCFYAYNYSPCVLRLCAITPNLDGIITELNYSHPGSAQELKELWGKLEKAAEKSDSWCKEKQKLPFIRSDSVSLNPIQAKKWASVLIAKLQHIYSLVKTDLASTKPPGSGDPKKTGTNAAEQDAMQTQKVKEPPKEAKQAYKLYYGAGITQEAVAERMSKTLKKPVSQGQVSKLLKQYKKWRAAEGIPVDDDKPTIIVNSEILDIGARTDGRLTGDPRHKKNADYGDADYNR
jgi:hypothetical protein